MTLVVGLRSKGACYLLADSAISVSRSSGGPKADRQEALDPKVIERVGALKIFDFGDCAVAYSGNVYVALKIIYAMQIDIKMGMDPLESLAKQVARRRGDLKKYPGGVSFLLIHRHEQEVYLTKCQSRNDLESVEHASEGEVETIGSASPGLLQYITELLGQWRTMHTHLGHRTVLASLCSAIEMSCFSDLLSVQSDLIDMPVVGVYLGDGPIIRREQSVLFVLQNRDSDPSFQMGVSYLKNRLARADFLTKKINADIHWENIHAKRTARSIAKLFEDPSATTCLSFFCPRTLRGAILLGASGGFYPHADAERQVLSHTVEDFLFEYDAGRVQGRRHVMCLMRSDARVQLDADSLDL